MNEKFVKLPEWLRDADGREILFYPSRAIDQSLLKPDACLIGRLAIENKSEVWSTVLIWTVSDWTQSAIGDQATKYDFALSQAAVDGIIEDSEGRLSLTVSPYQE